MAFVESKQRHAAAKSEEVSAKLKELVEIVVQSSAPTGFDDDEEGR